MSNDHKKLSRYDLERILGEAIQLHFNSWDGCGSWIQERMAMARMDDIDRQVQEANEAYEAKLAKLKATTD